MKRIIIIIAALCNAPALYSGHVHVINGTQFALSVGVSYQWGSSSDWFDVKPGGTENSSSSGDMTNNIEVYVHDHQQSVFDEDPTKKSTHKTWTRGLSLAGNTVQTLIVRQGVDEKGGFGYWIEH